MRLLVSFVEATILLAAIHIPSATSFTLPLSRGDTYLRASVTEPPIGISEEEDTSRHPSDAFELAGSSTKKANPLIDPILAEELEQSTTDIIRDLDGKPLSKEYFASKMGITTAVDSYSCPAEDAFRGFMSNACRVRLHPGQQTAFYKHIVFETLSHAREKLRTAPQKLVRDSKSYSVVASFLLSQACQSLMKTTGVCIPKCYDAQLLPSHDTPMDSKFAFLFQDLSPHDGWYQEWLLQDRDSCQAALSTFAKIHAYFWTGAEFWNDDNNNEAAAELEAGIWKSGSYVQPQAQGVEQCTQVAQEWALKKLKFEKELAPMEYWENLGERLESVARECGRLAHPFGSVDGEEDLSEEYKKYRTFTHGDPKQANLLFRRPTSSIAEDEKGDAQQQQLQVGLLDFQWSGFGLASTDIAHFMTSAVHADMLVDGGEEMLQRYYFDELQTHLVEYGAFDTAKEAAEHFPYHTFTDQYDTAVLDICRLMISYTWARFTEPVEKDDEAGKARTMNKTSYNKSVSNVVWLMSRCDEIMKSRGV